MENGKGVSLSPADYGFANAASSAESGAPRKRILVLFKRHRMPLVEMFDAN